MPWACPNDHHPLQEGAGHLECPGCGQAYPAVEEMPLFAHTPAELRMLNRVPAVLGQLWDRSRGRPVEEGLRIFGEALGASSTSFTTDWKFFVPLTADQTILEIGAGFGDDTVPLAARAGRVLSLVPSVLNARILRWRIPPEARNVSIAVVHDLSRLPLADGAVSAIAVEDAAASAFGLSTRSLDQAAGEWRRVLAPSGTLVVGLPHRGSRFLVRGSGPDTLNRALHRAQDGHRSRGLGYRTVLRSMRRQGFGPPEILAPLPDVARIEIVLPIESTAAVRYCFSSLLRQNSLASRTAIGLASLALRLRLLPRVVPYSYLIFSR